MGQTRAMQRFYLHNNLCKKNYDSEKFVWGSVALGASNTTWTRHVFFIKDITF